MGDYRTGRAARSAVYAQKLKDPRWQKRRLAILERDKWKCQQCEDAESTLHVHHRYYAKSGDPWDVPDAALVTLCESCHSYESDLRPEAEQLLLQVLRENGYTAENVWALMESFHAVRDWPAGLAAEIVRFNLRTARCFKGMAKRYFARPLSDAEKAEDARLMEFAHTLPLDPSETPREDRGNTHGMD